MAQVGVEPTASLVLSEGGLPIAYQAVPVPGAGVEPTSAGSEPDVLPVRRPRNKQAFRHGRASQGSGRRVEPSSPGSRPGSLPVSRSPRVPCGNRTHLSGLEDQHLCHSAKGTKAEGEGVEPSRLIARPFSGRLPSPIGLPFRSSCGGRNRTCNRLLNREPPYHWATPQKSGRWDLNPRFPVPETADSRLSYVLSRAPSGNRTRTSCMASRQAAVTSRVQVGPEGLEPSPRWLRARYAAANTWIPFGPEGVEPSSGPYKEPALAVELRANRAGGSRTHTLPLKRRIRCHYATAPNETRTYRFQRIATHHVCFSSK